MKLAPDKLLHFFYGSLISFPLVLFLGWWGLAISIIGFAFKEIVLDWLLNRGKIEFWDFNFSAIPAVLFYTVRRFGEYFL